eukprot:196349_1
MMIIVVVSTLWFMQFIAPVLLAERLIGTLTEFGFTTSSHSISKVNSGVETTINVWFNNKVFECEILANAVSTKFSCDAKNSWIGCDFNNLDSKIRLSHPSQDAVIIDSVFLTTDEATYKANGCCISDIYYPDLGRDFDNFKRDDYGEDCDESSWYTICIDNQRTTPTGSAGVACAPQTQYLYIHEYNARWLTRPGVCVPEFDSSSLSVEPCPWFKLQNKATGKCIYQNSDGRFSFYRCDIWDDQYWRMDAMDSNSEYFRLKNLQSGQCITNTGPDFYKHPTNSGFWYRDCQDDDSQFWKKLQSVDYDGEYFKLKNKKTGHCMYQNYDGRFGTSECTHYYAD